MNVGFCNPFDEALARGDVAAVFLQNREGLLRFDETWSRDAWGRNPGTHASGAVWLLLRDHDTSYVTLVFVTSPTLITSHPRADLRRYVSREEAEAALATFGTPPLCSSPW